MSFVVRLGLTWASVLLFLSIVALQYIQFGSAEFYILLVSVALIGITLIGLLVVSYSDWNPFSFLELNG